MHRPPGHRPDDAPAAPTAAQGGAGFDPKGRSRNRKRGKQGRGDRPDGPPNGQHGQPHGGPQQHHPGRGDRPRFNGQPQGGGGNGQGKRVRRVRPQGHEDREIRHAAREEATVVRHTGSWWADRWLTILHRFGWKGRLANGRLYADEGRVLSLTPEAGKIKARVQGTRTEPYEVTIGLKSLQDVDWELVVDIMSCQALFTAQLLAGEMPLDVEEAFDAAYAPLFPRTKEDLSAHCNCPDWANPCKHIAAVYYAMADAFDKDPFMVFHLRGRSREALIGMLRQQRAAEAMAMPMAIEALDAGSLEPFRFWCAGEELGSVHITIAPPAIPGGTAKRLGRPPFWRSPADPITKLGEVYEAIARRAREVALTEVRI